MTDQHRGGCYERAAYSREVTASQVTFKIMFILTAQPTNKRPHESAWNSCFSTWFQTPENDEVTPRRPSEFCKLGLVWSGLSNGQMISAFDHGNVAETEEIKCLHMIGKPCICLFIPLLTGGNQRCIVSHTTAWLMSPWHKVDLLFLSFKKKTASSNSRRQMLLIFKLRGIEFVQPI